MNLVKQIVDQLSGDVLHKLGSTLGTDTETTEYAATAAVPAILSGLAGLASRDDGAKKLAGVLGGANSTGLGDFAQMLGGDTSGLMQKGMGLLSSLLGDNATSSLASVIGNYAGLDSKTTKSLLAALLPMILGKVASFWKAKGSNAQALTSLFAEQKQNIVDAVPAGFSLADIPGLPGAKEFARSASDTGRRAAATAETASKSAASWILPLALLAIGAFILWQFLSSKLNAPEAAAVKPAPKSEQVTAMKPVMPDTTAMTTPDVTRTTADVTDLFKSLSTTLAGIKDAASAEAAAPQLEDANRKLDGIRGMFGKLPEIARGGIQKMITDQLGKLTDQVTAALGVPGISDRVKTLINEIVRKLDGLRMAQTTGAGN